MEGEVLRKENRRDKRKRKETGRSNQHAHGGRRGATVGKGTTTVGKGQKDKEGARSREELKMKYHIKLLPLYPNFKN